MQKKFTCFAWKYFDQKFNIHQNPNDYQAISGLLLEFYSEYSSYKTTEIEKDEVSKIYHRFIHPKTKKYEDSLRQEMYERQETHKLKNGIDLEEMHHQMEIFERDSKDHSPSYNDPLYKILQSDEQKKELCFKLAVSRNFVKDFHKVSSSQARKILDNYFFVISRGQIKDRTFIENYRKYSEDSFEFYTPIKDTDLILTWRFFADLHLVQGKTEFAQELVLMYTLSFDAISQAEYHSEYTIFDVSPLVESMIQRYGKSADEGDYNNFKITRDKSFSKVLFSYSIEFYLFFTKQSLSKLSQKEWYNFFDEKKPYKGDIVQFYPRFKETRFPVPEQLGAILCVKPGYQKWIQEKIELEEKLEKENPALPHLRTPEAQLELSHLYQIKFSAYDVLSSEPVDYTSFISAKPKDVKIYYEKVDMNTLKRSLEKLKYVEEKFTEDQKSIIYAENNVVYFGRSGTGKTHACVHTLVSRSLTASAIHKKLQKSQTNEKQINDNSITSVPANSQSGLRSIFITASPLLAKEVKAQYETILKRAEVLNKKEDIKNISEDEIFKQLHSLNIRSKELPKTFKDEDINYPLFLSHQEFVSILFNTMLESHSDFKTLSNKIELDLSNDDKLIEKRVSDILKTFTQSKMTSTLKYLPKRRSAAHSLHKKQLDFKIFYEEFYKKSIVRNNKYNKLASNLIWSEIRTKIKGSSFKYFEILQGSNYNPNDEVVKSLVFKNYQQVQNNDKIRNAVFEVFESYERWKEANGYFDIEDFVGLFYRKVKKWPFEEFNFDLVVVDEVQDLSFNSIQVLTNLCLNNFMICGDNAQNIEKGINFKFKDLKHFLSTSISNRSDKMVDYGNYFGQSQNLQKLQSFHLGLNFRSSKEILQMANMVVCLLETYFNDEIDSFPKEKGFFSTNKPIFIQLGEDTNFLVDFLEVYLKMEVEIVSSVDTSGNLADESMMSSSDTQATILTKNIKIGNDFCIIVRDEQSKKDVPPSLQNCIILTLQESKGLEFENVLLYNFFTNNDVEKGWRFILSRTAAKPRKRTREEEAELLKENDMFRKSKLEFRMLLSEFDPEKLIEFSTLVSLDSANTQAQIEGLSADLKFLYVAITRAKKNLILFDYSKATGHLRSDFEKLCEKTDLIDMVSQENLSIFSSRYQVDKNWKETQGQIARDKGYCFLKQAEYLAAQRFFKISNDQRLITYCKASEKAKMGGDLLSLDFDEELKKKYSSTIELQKNAYKMYLEAGEMFLSLEKFNEAGKCLFSAEKYSEALDCFQKVENKLYSTHCLFMMQKYEDALPAYYALEEDQLVQACLFQISECGRDMSKFIALLSNLSDETKEVNKLDDKNFMNYIKGVLHEVTKELEENQEVENIEPVHSKPTEEISENVPVISGDDFEVVESEKSSEFDEIKSVLSEFAKPSNLSSDFSKLLSLKKTSSFVDIGNPSSNQIEEIVNKLFSKLGTFRHRILQFLSLTVPSEILFSDKEIEKDDSNTMRTLIFDLALNYHCEDLALALASVENQDSLNVTSQKANPIYKEVISRITICKLLKLDTNLSFNKAVNFDQVPKEPRNKVVKDLSETACFSIFDILSVENKAVDIIIEEYFFEILIMGECEWFWPLSRKYRDELSIAIGKTRVCELRTNYGSNLEDVDKTRQEPEIFFDPRKVEDKDIKESLNQGLDVFLGDLTTSTKELNCDILKRFVQALLALLVKNSSSANNELMDYSEISRIIFVLRNLIRKQYAIKSGNKQDILEEFFGGFGIVQGSKLSTLSKGIFDGFMFIDKSSWLLQLTEMIPDLKKKISIPSEFILYSMNRQEDLFMVKSHILCEFMFTVISLVLLENLKLKNQSELMKLELSSRLSNKEKNSLKFSKLFSKKIEEVFYNFDYTCDSLANIEDNIYQRCLIIMGRPGQKPTTNLFSIYQYCSLLSRNPSSNKVVSELIRSNVKAFKNNRVFFLLEEIDDLFRKGEIAQSYYKKRDLSDYCDENSIELNKSTMAWLDLKEILILHIAFSLYVPKSKSDEKYFSSRTSIGISSYFEEEIRLVSWVGYDENSKCYYLDPSKINQDQIDEICHNIKDKYELLVNDIPNILFHNFPDLEEFIKVISSYDGTFTGKV